MIYIRDRGRLGNQFFIYALAKKLHQLYPEQKILIDTIELEHNNFDNELLNYNIKNVHFFNSKNEHLIKQSLFQKILCRFYFNRRIKLTPRKLFDHEKRFKKLYNHFGLVFCENGYIDFPKLSNKNIYFFGYFQSAHYFLGVENNLRNDLQTFHIPLIKNQQLLNIIKDNESVCITIRRGDYVNHPIHDICTVKYYEHAMEKIAKLINNPIFIAFSDDIQWVRDNIHFSYPVYFEDGNDPVYEKLRLMSKCKHFILSNSSFSWWACFLSENSDKKVISPNLWFNEDIPCDLIDNCWYQLNVNKEL